MFGRPTQGEDHQPLTLRDLVMRNDAALSGHIQVCADAKQDIKHEFGELNGRLDEQDKALEELKSLGARRYATQITALATLLAAALLQIVLRAAHVIS
jgi:hypothetical protein